MSDATYCSEAENLLAPVLVERTAPESNLRRSQRLLEKPPDIKIKFNWDNFVINKRGKLLPVMRKSLKRDYFRRVGAAAASTAPTNSVDILAGLVNTQTLSEVPLPPNQKTKSIAIHQSNFVSSELPKGKRRITDCSPSQPLAEVQHFLGSPLDLCKKRKLDTCLIATATQKDIIFIDLTKTEGIDSVPPAPANTKNASLGGNGENKIRGAQPRFGLSDCINNSGDGLKGVTQAATVQQEKDLGQQSQFMEAKFTKQAFLNRTCNQVRGTPNRAVEPTKIRRKNNRPKKAPRRSTNAKEPLPCVNKKEVVTKFLNLADFPERRQKPTESLNQTTININAKMNPLKTERYFDNRTQQAVQQRQFCESLLPATYPPHFREQIKVTDPMMVHQQNRYSANNIDPNFYLTPDLSQPCAFGASRSFTSTPSLPDSLRGVFDSDDLREILQLEKAVYHLTDQHVKALGVVLNLTVEYLREVLDNILTLSPSTLQKIELVLSTLPPHAPYDDHNKNPKSNSAARTRAFNQTTESSGASSVVECSLDGNEKFRHFPSQHWTQ